MVNYSASELGRIIGTGLSNASDYTDTFIESEELASLSLVPINTLLLSGSGYVYSKTLGSSEIISSGFSSYDLTSSTGLSYLNWTLTSGYGYRNTTSNNSWVNNYITTVSTIDSSYIGDSPTFFWKQYRNSSSNQMGMGIMANDKNISFNQDQGGISYWCGFDANFPTKIRVKESDNSGVQVFSNTDALVATVHPIDTYTDYKIVVNTTKGAKYYYKANSTNDDVIDDSGWTLLYDSTSEGNNNGRSYSSNLRPMGCCYSSDSNHRIMFFKYVTGSDFFAYPLYLDHPNVLYNNLDSSTIYLDGDFRTTSLYSSTIL